MPNSNKKKIVLPILAAVALVLPLWLAFHDRSVAATLAAAACAHRLDGASGAETVGFNPAAPSRTPARTADPASSRS